MEDAPDTRLDPHLIGNARVWREFAPGLHVGDAPPCVPFAVAADDARTIGDRIRREGYIQREPPDWDLPIAAMAAVIRALARQSLPAVLAFHYDEFWLLFWRMHAVIASVLGPDFRALPSFWAWHVDPASAGRGWAPHRDNGHRALFPDGTPKALTVWLPLTDATPLNGCMYLVPADRDPTYNTADEQQLKFQLSDIRALPARAGSLLAWTQGVIHWGASSAPAAVDRSSEPRISLSCEFQRADVAPFRSPLLDPTTPPDFALRRKLIGGVMLRYQQMHPLAPDLECLARAMTQGEETAGRAELQTGHRETASIT